MGGGGEYRKMGRKCFERMTLKCRDVGSAELKLAANSAYGKEISRVKGKIMRIARFCMDSSCSVCARVIA